MSKYLKHLVSAFIAVSLLNIPLPAAQAHDEVDLLLVLAADASYSISEQEFRLQREGHARAIMNPRVLNAIQSGAIGKIGVCYIEWSEPPFQLLVVEWTSIGDAESARNFTNRIMQAPRSLRARTSISGAIDFATRQIESAPFHSEHRVIDLSGDGDNNAGRNVRSSRDEAVAKGISINGLAILSADKHDHTHPLGGLENYYRDNVIGGSQAFVMVAETFDAFGSTLTKKLVAEIASASPSPEMIPSPSRLAQYESLMR